MPQTRKRFGQHFLEPVWADKVLQAIDPRPDRLVSRNRAGTRILTLRLAPKVARLVAVEIDRDLAAALATKAASECVRWLWAMSSESASMRRCFI
jgi:16S rRNA (adenine1518-N6/adenine1519-N6)-dimethyltransferase